MPGGRGSREKNSCIKKKTITYIEFYDTIGQELENNMHMPRRGNEKQKKAVIILKICVKVCDIMS